MLLSKQSYVGPVLVVEIPQAFRVHNGPGRGIQTAVVEHLVAFRRPPKQAELEPAHVVGAAPTLPPVLLEVAWVFVRGNGGEAEVLLQGISLLGRQFQARNTSGSGQVVTRSMAAACLTLTLDGRRLLLLRPRTEAGSKPALCQ